MTHTQATLNPDFKKEGDGWEGWRWGSDQEGHGKAGDGEVMLSTGFVLCI